MESAGGSTWIRFNGGNGCTVSPQSNPLYGRRSPVIYGKKTDASEGGSGTQRWLDRFFWVMRRPSAALNSCHSPGSCWRWLSAPVAPIGEKKRMRTYFQRANWKKMILMAAPQARFATVPQVQRNSAAMSHTKQAKLTNTNVFDISVCVLTGISQSWRITFRIPTVKDNQRYFSFSKHLCIKTRPRVHSHARGSVGPHSGAFS